jgi:uncharacterized protein
MRPTQPTIFTLLSMLFMLPGCNNPAPSANDISIGRVEVIHSTILNENRTVWIHVPEEHRKSDSLKYPVIYLLDGDAHFKSVVGLIDRLSDGSAIAPKAIVVAVLNTNRPRDLTPTNVKSRNEKDRRAQASGGGERFTQFLSEELIPHIEKHYPAANDRMLIGHSLGGLLVINTLIRHPHLFNKYLAIDPSLWWDDWKLIKESTHALQQQNYKEKSLYVAIANTVPIDTLTAQQDTSESTTHYRAITHFVNMLRNDPPRGLDWRARFYPDENHGSVALASELDALRFLYRKIPIKLETEALKAFEGRYKHQFENGVDSFLDVVAEDGVLVVKESWATYPMKFSPIKSSEFYCFQKDFPITFQRNKEGEVSELVAFNTDVWKKVR